MKIVITGKNSHIGNKIQNWFESHQIENKFEIEQLDVIGDGWKTYNFSGTDVIIHVAAIVHQPKLKDWSLYQKVNIDLPSEIASKAKASGVKQFVFFSTMAVYGWDKDLNTDEIDEVVVPSPKSMYGKSKYEAELALKKIESDNFLLSIVRPPNVYGENGKLGYVDKFAKFLKYWRVIPDAYREVRQSMIYIDNLTEFIRQIVIKGQPGTFMPQDSAPVSAICLIDTICEAKQYRIFKSKFLGMIVKLFAGVPIVQKLYGGVAYTNNLSQIDGIEYQCVKFENGIKESLNN